MLQAHVFLSLVGIVTGCIALFGMLCGRLMRNWVMLFLVTTILTSLSGFPLAPFGFDPPRAVGVLSLLLLAAAVAALYAFHLVGIWRWVYVGGAVAALYLNCFVGVVQAFQKLPFLQALAPTQSEPPFVISQAVVLLVFLGLGVICMRRFRPSLRG